MTNNRVVPIQENDVTLERVDSTNSRETSHEDNKGTVLSIQVHFCTSQTIDIIALRLQTLNFNTYFDF